MLAQPSAHETTLRLMRSQCTPNTIVECHVLTGMDGCRVTVDGLEVAHALKPSEAMEALHQARRLVMVGAHDALAMLTAALALAPSQGGR